MVANNEIKRREKTYISLYEALTLMVLFLASVNFMNRYVYFVYIAFVFVFMHKNLTIPMKGTVFALVLLGVSYILFLSSTTDSLTNMIKSFTYLVCYLIGYNYVRPFGKETEMNMSSKVLRLIVVVALGNCGHLILNMFLNQGINTSVLRDTMDFWTRQPMAATGQAALGCIAIAVGIATLFSEALKKYKLFSLAMILVILYYNLTLAGRTLIIMTLIVLVLALGRLILSSKLSSYRKALTITGIVICVIIFFLLYSANVGGIKSIIVNSNIYERFFGEYKVELNEDSRLEFKLMYIEKILEHPWGNKTLRKAAGGHYAHDLYLDTCSDAGIFALLAIAIYVLSSLSRLLKIMKNKNVSFIFKQVIFCVYFIINIEFWLEPVIEGIPWFLASYCLIDGAVACFISMNRDGENDRNEVEEGAV